MDVKQQQRQQHTIETARAILQSSEVSFIEKTMALGSRPVDRLTRADLDRNKQPVNPNNRFASNVSKLAEHAWHATWDETVASPDFDKLNAMAPYMPTDISAWFAVHEARINEITSPAASIDLRYLAEDTAEWDALPWLASKDGILGTRSRLGAFSGPFDRAEAGIRLMLLDAQTLFKESQARMLQVVEHVGEKALDELSVIPIDVDDSAA